MHLSQNYPPASDPIQGQGLIFSINSYQEQEVNSSHKHLILPCPKCNNDLI